MVYRTRIKYTAAQKAEIWDLGQRREGLTAIGRLLDRPTTLFLGNLSNCGLSYSAYYGSSTKYFYIDLLHIADISTRLDSLTPLISLHVQSDR